MAPATYGYDPNGNLTSRLINPNATNSSFQYNALNQVTNITHNFVSDTLGPRTFAYDYDSVGNRKWAKRQTGTGEVFGYDLNDQVTAAKIDISNPDTTPIGSQTISYDANGNRTSFAAFDPTDPRTGTTDTYSTSNNKLNQYGSRTNTGNQTNASYDTKGNLLTFNGWAAPLNNQNWTYTYDAQNRLKKASNGTGSGTTTYEFAYDGLNRQVSRTINGGAPTYNVWDGWELIEEIQSGSVTAAYVTGATGLVKNLVSGNYYYQDGSGSTSHLAGSSGQLLEWYRYDLHGTPRFYNALNTQLSASNYSIRHLFTGQQWYSDLGLYDLRNRFYSPDLGRFLQPDPIGFDGDGTNLYRYCGNDPVNLADPFGDDARITSSGYNVQIAARFTFTGLSQANIRTFYGGIRQYFRPQTGSPYSVSLNFDSGPYISVWATNAKSGYDAKTNTILWNPQKGGIDAAHEFGHAVGAPHSCTDGSCLMSGGPEGSGAERPGPLSPLSETDILNILNNHGKGVSGNMAAALFAGGRVWFGLNSNGGGMYNNGNGWQPIGSAPADIRWQPNSGTGNFNASQFVKYWLAGGQGSGGEGEHPVPYNLM